MHPHTGYRVEPYSHRRINRIKGGELQSVEEVALEVIDGFFHATFLLGLAHGARLDGKAIVVGEVQIAGIDYGGLAPPMLEHRDLTVVDHDLLRNATQELKGMLMSRQEVLHRFSQDTHPLDTGG
jgi:hypothetical protein